MEVKLLVTPETLQATAGEFDAQATQMKALHDSMLNKVRSLGWEGEISNAYNTEFNTLEISMNKIFAMIQEHVTVLYEIVALYSNDITPPLSNSKLPNMLD